MAGLKSMVIVLAVMMVASFQPKFAVAQTRHVVGDTLGWNVPSNSNAYTTWATGKTFTVGDSLVFNFATGAHDVAEVLQASYGPCTKANPINTTTTGPATITLSRPGNHYYICTFGTHCQLGQKLTINVAASSSTTPPSATSPAPSGAMPTSPDGMPSPPPPSPSSASAFTAMVPVTFLAAVMALFY